MVSLLELAFLKTWLWNHPRQNAWGSRASHVLSMQIPGPHPRPTESDSLERAQDCSFSTLLPQALGKHTEVWERLREEFSPISHRPVDDD